MPALRMIDARWANLVCQRLKDRRVPLAPLLREIGLTQAQVNDPECRIAFRKHAALLTAAADLTGDASFALRLATTLSPRQAGPIGFIALSSQTLGDALRNFRRYQRVLSEGVGVHMESEGDRTALCAEIIDPRVEDPLQATEFVLGGGVTLCRRLAGPDLEIERVELAHARHGRLSDYRKLLSVPLAFGQGRNAIVMKSAMLQLPLKTADDQLLAALTRLCQQILGDQPDDYDLVYQVRRHITERLPSGEPTMDRVAEELGMSSRTLSRRLAEQEVTYRELLDQTRHQLALRYLKSDALRPSQIAYLLGYSEPSGFHHAFSRWTGQPPSRFRSGAAAA